MKPILEVDMWKPIAVRSMHTIRSATAFLYAAAAMILIRRLGRYA